MIHWQFSQQISSLHGSAGSVSVQRDDWQTLWCTISCVTAHSTTSRWEKTCSNVLSTGEFPDADLWVSFEGILLDCIYPQIENILPFFWSQGQNNTDSSWCAKFLSFPSLFSTSLVGHLTLRQQHEYRVRSRLAAWCFPQVSVFDAMIKVAYLCHWWQYVHLTAFYLALIHRSFKAEVP